MKKVIAIALIICLVPACSYALDLSEFNANAVMLGEKEIDLSTEGRLGNYITYTSNGCQIGFVEQENQISNVLLDGDGVSFLAYAMAAIMLFDDNANTFRENAGKLLAAYLLLRTSDRQYDIISTGQAFVLMRIDDACIFTIGR